MPLCNRNVQVWNYRIYQDTADLRMGNVMVIPARRQVGNTVKKSALKKLRVAAYCRVSTDSEEQETSYEAQVTHYTEYI